MTDTSPQGSIAALTTTRHDLLGFAIDARIHEADIEWMAREVEAAFKVHGEIDMILVMRHYDGADLSAVFDRVALKAQARSAMHVRRYAVVGAPPWAKAMINLFSPLSPIEAKTFELRDEPLAWQWVDDR